MPPRAKASAVPATTAQALGSLLKSARDIMRKDKGLNGDLDRLPLLTWIMFLKFLGDLETQREQGAALARKKFGRRSSRRIAARLGGHPQGITGDECCLHQPDEAVAQTASGEPPLRLPAPAHERQRRRPPRRHRHRFRGVDNR